jgi:hypothetical protein
MEYAKSDVETTIETTTMAFPEANEFHIFTTADATATTDEDPKLPLLLLNYYEQMTGALESSISSSANDSSASLSSRSSLSCDTLSAGGRDEETNMEDLYESIVRDLIATAELGFHMIALNATIELDKIEAQRAYEFKMLIRAQFPRTLLSFQEAFESGIERPDWLYAYHIQGGAAFSTNSGSEQPKNYNPNAVPKKRVHPAAEKVAFHMARPQLFEYEVDISYRTESYATWRRINDFALFYHFVMAMFRLKYGAKTHRSVSWIVYSEIAEMVEDTITGACVIWNEEQDAYSKLMREEFAARKPLLVSDAPSSEIENEEIDFLQTRFFSAFGEEPIVYSSYKHPPKNYIPFFTRQTPVDIINVMFSVPRKALVS